MAFLQGVDELHPLVTGCCWRWGPCGPGAGSRPGGEMGTWRCVDGGRGGDLDLLENVGMIVMIRGVVDRRCIR